MSSNTIPVQNLAREITRGLQENSGLVMEDVQKSVDKVASETVKELKEISPEGPTGDYKESWTNSIDNRKKTATKHQRVVYSKKPDYRLTHLLEFGHAKVSGGRVAGIPHISVAEKHAAELLVLKIKKSIEMRRNGR